MQPAWRDAVRTEGLARDDAAESRDAAASGRDTDSDDGDAASDVRESDARRAIAFVEEQDRDVRARAWRRTVGRRASPELADVELRPGDHPAEAPVGRDDGRGQALREQDEIDREIRRTGAAMHQAVVAEVLSTLRAEHDQAEADVEALLARSQEAREAAHTSLLAAQSDRRAALESRHAARKDRNDASDDRVAAHRDRDEAEIDRQTQAP